MPRLPTGVVRNGNAVSLERDLNAGQADKRSVKLEDGGIMVKILQERPARLVDGVFLPDILGNPVLERFEVVEQVLVVVGKAKEEAQLLDIYLITCKNLEKKIRTLC